MAKGKKKGRQQAESSDEEPKQSTAIADDDSDGEVKSNKVTQPSKAAKKKDKKKLKKIADLDFHNDSDIDPIKNRAKRNSEDEEESEEEMRQIMKSKSKKDKKKRGGFAALAIDDSDGDEISFKPKSGFAALMDDDSLSDDCLIEAGSKTKKAFVTLEDSDDDTNAKPESCPNLDENKDKRKEKRPKETKSKKGKKAEEAPAEEEDIDKLLADMNIEIKEVSKKEKKKKKKDAKTPGDDDISANKMNDVHENANDMPPTAAALSSDQPAGTPTGKEECSTVQDKKAKKKKKKKDPKETPADGEEADPGEAKPDKSRTTTKKPNKAILQMHEALRKREEETRRLEEKAREEERRAEEAEKLRVQKLLEEKERQEQKKQRDREKREKLKAEGKLLTKAQKIAQARARATLEALREQGVNIPPLGGDRVMGEKPKRAPLNRRIKKTQDEAQPKQEANSLPTPDETPAEETPTNETYAEETPAENKEPITPSSTESLPSAADEKKAADDSEEDVRETWDATSDSEGEHKACDGGEAEKPVAVEGSKLSADRLSSTSKITEPSVDEEDSSDEPDSSREERCDDEESSNDDDARSNDEEIDKHERLRHKVLERIRKRRELNEKKRSTDNLRSPVICVLGHVDTGKTKILDYIRRTHVQDNEAGGITQQIGATMVPLEAIKEQCKAVKDFASKPLRIPGALIIDTPGHESFSNLRSRGSSLCDMAILVVDIMHGLEPQTVESINLLKAKRTPFVVALNKIDRLYDWKSNKHKDIVDVLNSQARNTKQEFEEHSNQVIAQFAEQGLNAALFNNNPDPKTFISLVPTSAFTGDGMGNLISLVVELTQKMLAQRIAYSEELQATVLEVKATPGLGTTIDVIVVNGELKEGDTMVLAGHEGPFVTQIRSLLMPQPLKELRVKNAYQEFKAIKGAQGVKIAAKDLEKAIAGLNVLVAQNQDEIEFLKQEIARALKEVMGSFKLHDKGVYVQASTLGSLEALLAFLRDSKIPYSGIRIGPVVKKDVIRASVMLEHDSQYAVILAFDVKVERDAQELADHTGVRIFSADIIYHLFDKFMAHREDLRQKKREEYRNIAIFPCKLRILPQFIFKSRDPIIVGVMVEAGVVKLGTPICVPSKDNLLLGSVASIQVNHKPQETAKRGEEVCIRIDNTTSEAPKLYGRHFDHTDILFSKITRESIDACKEYFRTDLTKQDWQLMVELKKVFQIL